MNDLSTEQRIEQLEAFARDVSQALEQMANAPAEIAAQFREAAELGQRSVQFQQELAVRLEEVSRQSLESIQRAQEMYQRLSERISYLEERL